MRVSVISATGIMLLVTFLLQGCGHKGPLVLPAPAAATTQPEPSPAK